MKTYMQKVPPTKRQLLKIIAKFYPVDLSLLTLYSTVPPFCKSILTRSPLLTVVLKMKLLNQGFVMVWSEVYLVKPFP